MKVENVALPTEIVDVYRSLKEEVIDLHAEWKLWRQLYGCNQQRVNLLAISADLLFGRLHQTWMDSILLRICRLTDPSKQLKFNNLVLWRLQEASAESVLVNRLELIKNAIKVVIDPMRDRRNTAIGHNSLSHILNSNQLHLSSRIEIEKALEFIRSYINLFAEFHDESRIGYEALGTRDDGDDLSGVRSTHRR